MPENVHTDSTDREKVEMQVIKSIVIVRKNCIDFDAMYGKIKIFTVYCKDLKILTRFTVYRSLPTDWAVWSCPPKQRIPNQNAKLAVNRFGLTIIINFSYQLWDFVVSFGIPEHCTIFLQVESLVQYFSRLKLWEFCACGLNGFFICDSDG